LKVDLIEGMERRLMEVKVMKGSMVIYIILLKYVSEENGGKRRELNQNFTFNLC